MEHIGIRNSQISEVDIDPCFACFGKVGKKKRWMQTLWQFDNNITTMIFFFLNLQSISSLYCVLPSEAMARSPDSQISQVAGPDVVPFSFFAPSGPEIHFREKEKFGVFIRMAAWCCKTEEV